MSACLHLEDSVRDRDHACPWNNQLWERRTICIWLKSRLCIHDPFFPTCLTSVCTQKAKHKRKSINKTQKEKHKQNKALPYTQLLYRQLTIHSRHDAKKRDFHTYILLWWPKVMWNKIHEAIFLSSKSSAPAYLGSYFAYTLAVAEKILH